MHYILQKIIGCLRIGFPTATGRAGAGFTVLAPDGFLKWFIVNTAKDIPVL
jgi:hypothetical protein